MSDLLAPARRRLVRKPVVAYLDETLRLVVFRMAETGFTRMPVLDSETGSLAGMISLRDLLGARSKSCRRTKTGARDRIAAAVRREGMTRR